MTNHPYQDVPTGARLFRNTGELSFETRPRSAGTFPVVFLSPVEGHDATGRQYVKIINENGRTEVVHTSLVSAFNI